MSGRASSPSVAAVILNWNGSQVLGRSLEAVASSQMPAGTIEVIVVDNGSTDGSPQLAVDFASDPASRNLTRVEVIRLPRNMGAPAALNIGIAHASPSVRYIWKLDNDTVPRTDCLPLMLSALTAASPDVQGAVSARIVRDESGTDDAVGAFRAAGFRRWSSFHRYVKAGEAAAEMKSGARLVMLVGTCCLISRAALEAVSGFDERFFLYYDETDLFERMVQEGRRLLVAPDAVVHHLVSHSSRNRPEVQLYYMTRHHLLFGAKHFTGVQRALMGAFQVVLLLRSLARIWLRREAGRRVRTRALVRGVVDFARGRFGPYPG